MENETITEPVPRGGLTEREYKTAEIVAAQIKNGETPNTGKAMLAAGFPTSTVKGTTDRISYKEEFREVLRLMLPPKRLLKRHMELMEQDDDIGAAVKATELAYKVGGVMDTEQNGNSHAFFLTTLGVQEDTQQIHGLPELSTPHPIDISETPTTPST